MMGGRSQDSETNTYKVVVVSSDDAPGATTDGAAPADDDSNLPKMAYHKVTVEVTDVDEDGSVSLSALAAPGGRCLTSPPLKPMTTPPDEGHQDASTAQINGQVEVGAVLGHGRPLDPDLR